MWRSTTLIRTPELLVLVLPVAFLLALLYALTNHARHHELTAIRAAGVSLWRLALPVRPGGIVPEPGRVGVNDGWCRTALIAAERVLESAAAPDRRAGVATVGA